ncbi:MAG: gamma-glutamylcyclotransferase [Burkholderiaceae bacterium]|nr:gamma-glutamylcyclotransferase [Burkholderiaceae bacterium]MBP7659681.1 gamma-glutamylcyclotransferase [Burkholderiaceae bacterium]
MTSLIDRDFLRGGGLSQALAQAERDGLLRLTSAPERQVSRDRMLALGWNPGTDLWIFAYGSLMWNPAFHFVESRTATIHGFHRRFCLHSQVGRGTSEIPGLMLGLDRGGSCRGIALRIAAAQVHEELDIIWSREMVAAAYRPVWVRARTQAGTLAAITFAIDESLPTYAGRLPLDEVARRIARASGPLGRCADYLAETVAHLEACGIHDRSLAQILRRVRALPGRSEPDRTGRR